MSEITMPYNWFPRPYQEGMWKYFQKGGKRAFLLGHRRSGKDDNSLHWTATAAIQKAANYWYMLPQKNQVRKAIWDAINPHTGKKRIDEAFPDQICIKKRDTDMAIELINGSMVHFIGSDAFDALVGSPPYGLVFSEFSLTNPSAWAYLRPILDENGGWALFNTTPRGRNHAWSMYEYAKEKGWYTVTWLPTNTKVFTPEQLEEARNEYYALYGEEDGEALFNQEYWCSWDAALVGSYYGHYITDLERNDHIKKLIYENTLPVHTAWDLGVDDSTAIWFFQIVGREIHVLDYLEGSGQGLEWYVKELNKKPYVYGDHLLPHDIKVKEMGTGKTRLEMLRSFGLVGAQVVPLQSVADGINAVRVVLPRCYFDIKKCEKGLEALRMYRREYDDLRRIYHDRPVHDWTSHAADAFRYLSLGISYVFNQERAIYNARKRGCKVSLFARSRVA